MDYDFFDEEIEENPSQNTTQRNHTPSVSGREKTNEPKKKGGKIRWWYIFGAICAAVFFFFGGYVLCWNSFDLEMHTLRSVKEQIQQNYYEEITDEEFYDAVFDGVNEKLLDAYSGYMTPKEYSAVVREGQGNRQGVGLVFAGNSEEPLRILRVCGNSPAETAGIKAGETVLSCGKTEESLTTCATFEEFSKLLDGYAEGEEFFLGLQTGVGTRAVKLCKRAYVENYVFYRTNEKSYAFTGEKATELTEKGDPLSYLDDDTAYIQLLQFTGNAAEEFAGAMNQFKAEGKKNLVLDLRGNGGGYLEIMLSIASYFCKDATETMPVVAIADYGKYKVPYVAQGNYYEQYFAEDSRVCVLADKNTASAAECLIGCMVDYGTISYEDICLVERGGVAKTYGKGIMQETRLVSFFQMDALKLTTARILWPKGDCIHGRGVLPMDGAKKVAENADVEKETQAAIELLLG